jgi:hypothetical protein
MAKRRRQGQFVAVAFNPSEAKGCGLSNVTLGENVANSLLSSHWQSYYFGEFTVV